MFSRRLKTGYFILEGLNSFALVYYSYYSYFFMQKAFGFDNKANLALAAFNGAVYALFSWQAGKFAQRFGYFTSLKLGFLLMMMALAVGWRVGAASAAAQIGVLAVTYVGMCFTWPSLEALVSEGEASGGVQHMVGVYNVVWAGTAALASFTGGVMFEHLGFASLFYVPIALQLIQFGLIIWLESQAVIRPQGAMQVEKHSGSNSPAGEVGNQESTPAAAGTIAAIVASNAAESGRSPHLRFRATSFQRMAWLANPFAYIAINTLIALFPGIAVRLHLSPMLAGFCCSVWCFARLGAFFGLWSWNGWHYHFRWLLLSYLALVGTFATILVVSDLAVLVLAQTVFGGAVGLIYYSSLFYSMDSSDTKGEHGGIHEAAIGLGNFAGPAVGAAALQFLPRYGNSGALAVSLLLLGGLAGLTAIWRAGRTP